MKSTSKNLYKMHHDYHIEPYSQAVHELVGKDVPVSAPAHASILPNFLPAIENCHVTDTAFTDQ